MKAFHTGVPQLQLSFGVEFVHFVWSTDLGPADDSVAAFLLYTLTNR